MKTLKLVEAAARYEMSARAFEQLLAKLGWMLEGQVAESAVLKGYLTVERELTPLGQGYLFEASRE